MEPTTENLDIAIEVFPALNGDCILISYHLDHNRHILIDCGYRSTYKEFLKPRLLELASKGEGLDKLIITHIDSDHIRGAIPLLEDNQSHYIEIQDIWHNSLKHIRPHNVSDNNVINSKIDKILERGYFDNEKFEPIQISGHEGTTVGALILKGAFNWNKDFNGDAVCIENGSTIKLDGGAVIDLLSPTKSQLNKLDKKYTDDLRQKGIIVPANYDIKYDDAFEMLMSWEKPVTFKRSSPISSKIQSIPILLDAPFIEDSTTTNGSSIAFIFTTNDKRLLFLGDSHPSTIIASLKSYDKPQYFDLIKVSHHGSRQNTSAELLDYIDSERYLFLTNGSNEHHPDPETIAKVVSRNTTFTRVLYFNYKTSGSELFNKVEWMHKYNYRIEYVDTPPYKIEL